MYTCTENKPGMKTRRFVEVYTDIYFNDFVAIFHEKHKDTKRVIRIYRRRTRRKYFTMAEREKNDQQRKPHQAKDRVTRTVLNH